MKKKKEKKLTNAERLNAAIINSAPLMGDIKPIKDDKLHVDGENITIGDLTEQNDYKTLDKTQRDEIFAKQQEDLSKFIEENTEDYVDFDERFDDDRENLFYQNLNKKYMDYVDNLQAKKQEQDIKTQKVRLPWFRKIRAKLASELFEHKLEASDNACPQFKRVIDSNFHKHLGYNNEVLLRSFFEGKTELNVSQSNEFLTFGKVWKLFVLTIKTKCEHMKYNCYMKLHGLILKLVKDRDYYGHNDLEEMMNATGGLPYDTLLSNHGVDPDCMNHIVDADGKVIDIRKELLKRKIDSTLPKPVDFNIDDFFKDIEYDHGTENVETKEEEPVEIGLEENKNENLEKV
jgi:hypothetical protein